MRYVQLFIRLLLPCMVLAAGCMDQDERGMFDRIRELRVSAAASLKDAFTEMAERLEQKDSTVKITLNIGASNVLGRQIAEGAPVGLFASANQIVMDSLEAQGRIFVETRRTFAYNRLVVVVPQSSELAVPDLAALTAPGFERIAVASKGVPAGRYAEQALRKVGVWDSLTDRFVYGANVRQVVDYVARGEVSAGLVYATDAAAFSDRVTVALQVDTVLSGTISYPLAVVQDTEEPEAAGEFSDFILSEEGAAVLRRYGFEPAEVVPQKKNKNKENTRFDF